MPRIPLLCVQREAVDQIEIYPKLHDVHAFGYRLAMVQLLTDM